MGCKENQGRCCSPAQLKTELTLQTRTFHLSPGLLQETKGEFGARKKNLIEMVLSFLYGEAVRLGRWAEALRALLQGEPPEF